MFSRYVVLSWLLVTVGSFSCLAAEGWKKHVVAEGRGGIPSAVACDLNGDGHVDILSHYDGQLVAFAGPKFTRHVVHTFDGSLSRNKMRPASIHSCLIDADADGDLDFVGSSNTVFWVETPDEPFSGKSWKARSVDDQILGTHCVLVGDVNRDDKPDLIANSGRSSGTEFPNSLTWLEIPADVKNATAWKRHLFGDRDAPGGSHYTGIADINGDGRPDISCAAKGGEGFPGGQWFAWWEQPADPTGIWKKHLLAEKEVGATNILPADLNGDGHIDFFATRGHGQGVLWFRGPDFELIDIDKTIEGPHCLVLADLDDDGDLDAATCGRDVDGQAVWYENDGRANFTRHLIGENQSSYDIRAVDLDNDGDLDLLIGGQRSRNIVWFENPVKARR